MIFRFIRMIYGIMKEAICNIQFFMLESAITVQMSVSGYQLTGRTQQNRFSVTIMIVWLKKLCISPSKNWVDIETIYSVPLCKLGFDY